MFQVSETLSCLKIVEVSNLDAKSKYTMQRRTRTHEEVTTALVDAIMDARGQLTRDAKSITRKATHCPKKYKFNTSEFNKSQKITFQSIKTNWEVLAKWETKFM